jgi:hypothetical protein
MWSKSVTFHIPKAECSSLVGTRCVYTKRCSAPDFVFPGLSMVQGPGNFIDCLTKGVPRPRSLVGDVEQSIKFVFLNKEIICRRTFVNENRRPLPDKIFKGTLHSTNVAASSQVVGNLSLGRVLSS